MTRQCKLDLVGQRFGRYEVLAFVPDDGKYSSFLCRCDCGAVKKQYSFDLVSGNSLSCGCLKSDRVMATHRTHGQSGTIARKRTRTYRSWASMMDRCIWGGNKRMFSLYGANGITVCERWHKFENFYADMGERPPNTSLDRINCKGNYEPSNCRWASPKIQSRNRSTVKKVVYEGNVVLAVDLIEKLNIPSVAFRSRAARRGNDFVKALKSYGVDCDYYVEAATDFGVRFLARAA